LPADLPRALANHCAEEYSNLGALLPELYRTLRRIGLIGRLSLSRA